MKKSKKFVLAGLVLAAITTDYAKATGLEALFGYLYLSGEEQRLRELFGKIVAEKESA